MIFKDKIQSVMVCAKSHNHHTIIIGYVRLKLESFGKRCHSHCHALLKFCFVVRNMLQLYLPLCQDQLYLPASLPPDVSHQAPQAPSTTQLGRHFVANPPKSCSQTILPYCGLLFDDDKEEEEENSVYDTNNEDDNNKAKNGTTLQATKPPSPPCICHICHPPSLLEPSQAHHTSA